MSFHFGHLNPVRVSNKPPTFARIGALFCIAVFLTVPLDAEQSTAVVARDAWVRLPAASKTQTALYVVFENHSPEKRKAVSAICDVAQTAEMHEMTMTRAMMVMAPVSEVSIPAKGKRSLDPNGYHLMLFGLKTKLAVGDVVHATFTLDDGSTVPVTATVRK